MSKKYIQNLAEKVVKVSLPLKKGDCVLISGPRETLEFLEILAVECFKIGACPLIRVDLSGEAMQRVLVETPLGNLKTNPKHYLAILNEIGAQISVSTISKMRTTPPKNSKHIQTNIKTLNKSFEVVWDAIVNKKIKFCAVTIPSSEDKNTRALILRSLNADLDYMRLLGRRLQRALAGAERVHMTCESGTDITLKVGKRIVIVDDGVLDEEDLKSDFQVYLPGGVVCTAPLEESVNGKIVAKYAYDQMGLYNGVIKNLTLVFESGRLVHSSSTTNYKIFKKILDSSSGDKDRLAEFGIGINPEVKRLVGEMKIDELMHGSAHIAIGHNAHYDGKNVSDLHWDFIVQKPTITVDGKCIVKKGIFKFDLSASAV